MNLRKGSVIQANENAGDWTGCLLMVDEVRPWGVQAFMHIPKKGDAYVRLTHDQFDDLGADAVLLPVEVE